MTMESMFEDQTPQTEPRLRDLPITFFNIPRWFFLLFIRSYQKVISPAVPVNTCRFYPTCSHYGYRAIYKYGALRGGDSRPSGACYAVTHLIPVVWDPLL